MKPLVAIFLSLSASLAVAAPPTAPIDGARIEELTKLKGTLDEKENVYKITVPRTDLSVKIGGVHLATAMGLASWAAFTRTQSHVMVMGDLCLTEEQVNPVMDVALENGLEVTALHNHFLRDLPKVMFMHVSGMGDEAQLATAIGKVFEAVKKKRLIVKRISFDAANAKLNATALDQAIGEKGETVPGGVYKVVVGRVTKMGGFAVGKAMGVSSWAAFGGTDALAAVDGDVAVMEWELQPVLKALRKGKLEVMAIHQHMALEQPRVLFVHYFGTGPAVELAKSLKEVFDLIKVPAK